MVAILRPPSASLATDSELAAEREAREDADTALTQALADEATDRQTADALKLDKAANLSDLGDVEEAKANMGVGLGAERRMEAAALTLDFPSSIVYTPTGSEDYAGFPGTTDTMDGAMVVVFRQGSRHDSASGGTPGILRMVRSFDLGRTWSAPETLFDDTALGDDLRDPCLVRAPGTRRIYLTWFVDSPGSTEWKGLRIAWSDDGGDTWSAAQEVTSDKEFASVPPRVGRDGRWYWPYYTYVGTFTQAKLFVADDPLGAWTSSDVLSHVSENRTEWDFVEVSPTNWIGIVRGASGSNLKIIQSTDQGATWSAETAFDGAGGVAYDGWPTLRLGLDGRVLLFVRRQGAGLGVIQLLDVDNPLVAANWREPGPYNDIMGPLDSDLTKPRGKFQPVRVGSAWMGAYYADTTITEAAEIRWGALDERALRGSWSYVPDIEKIPDGSTTATWQTLATPDRVIVRTVGGRYRISYRVRSFQASGSVHNFNIDVALNGVRFVTTNSLLIEVSGSTRQSANAYYDTAEGVVHLTAGVHTFDLWVMQFGTTVGRSFYQRHLMVEPL